MIRQVIWLLLFCPLLTLAQEKELAYDLALTQGSIYAHTKDVENTKGARPIGIEWSFVWRKTDSTTYRKFYGFPSQGISVQWTNFDNAILGRGFTAAYFIEPDIHFGQDAGMGIRAAAGMAFLNNPHDPQKNPTNSSYSTRLNSYLALGLRPYWQISSQWQAFGMLSYRHTSNGGVSLPNKGVNWITMDAGLRYYPNKKQDLRERIQRWKQLGYQKTTRWDIGMFYASRSIDNTSAERFGVLGLSLLVSKQTGRTHAFTLGAELYQDNALREQLKADTLQASAIKSGLLLGHEFLWGRFIFSQQIGMYLFDQSPYYPVWYHRWGLLYRVRERWLLGFQLKAHKHIALFPDLRIQYSFKKRSN
ncbi:MAG: acyloxyacyl hydrolase [Chitinophagales bacterium]|jgi:hypothetical protein|nr:acyloxyacyl hydrolase [Chitinophagales bacterium]